MTSYHNQCRICLEYGAIYSLFDNEEDPNSIYYKLTSCIKEKIYDIEGFPRLICGACCNSLDIVYNFYNKYRQTEEILQNNLPYIKTVSTESLDENINIKTEYLDDDEIYEYDDYLKSITGEEILIVKVEETKTEDILNVQDILLKLPNITVKKKYYEESNDETNSKKIKRCELSETNDDSNNNKKSAKRPKKSRPDQREHKRKGTENLKPQENSRTPEPIENAKNELSQENSRTPEPIENAKNELSQENSRTPEPIENAENESSNSETESLKVTDNNKHKNPCDYCGVTFKSKTEYQDHKFGCRCYTCFICKAKYYSRYELEQHKEKLHANCKNHVCDQCGMVFYFKSNLFKHVMKAHPEKAPERKVYRCKICPKTFICATSLRYHNNSHTGNFPFVCQFCAQGYTHYSYLTDHLRNHTGEMPYKCPICGKPHKQNCNMKSHIRHNHRRSDLDEETLKKLHPRFLKHLKPD